LGIVWIPMNQTLYVAVMVCATMVNTQTYDTHWTAFDWCTITVIS